MFTKRSMIVMLVGLNLFLLAVLLFGSYSLPAAYAQVGARPGDFACVTAKVAGQTYDVLYVLDVPSRKLYAFYPTGGHTNQLAATQPRDLAKDFDRK